MSKPQLKIIQSTDDIKECATCHIIKNVTAFGIKKSNRSGIQIHCKACLSAAAKLYPSNSRDNRKIVEARYRLKYPGRRAEIVKKSKLKNPETTKLSQKNTALKNKTNLKWRLASNLRRRLLRAIKNNQKTGSAVADLGCTIEELKSYLESKFLPGMSWENYGFKGWHIDHIKPLASFNLSNRQEFLAASNFTNLQPLWSQDNWKKGIKSA